MYKPSSAVIATEPGDGVILLEPGTGEPLVLGALAGRIDVRFLASPPWLSTPPHDGSAVIALDGATLTWLRHGDRWWSTHRDRAGVELELLDDRARIQAWHGTRLGMPRFDAERAPWMMRALHVAICEAMRARGFIPLRAAVIARDGHATALIARSEAAKTTSMSMAAESGWLPVAEHSAWLDVTTRGVFAWTGDNQKRRRIPGHWRHAAWRQCDDKLVFACDETSPSCPATAMLTRIVVVHRNMSRDSGIEPLPLWESTRVLSEISGLSLFRSSRDAFAALVPDLVSQLECGRLVVGRTPFAL